MHTFRKILATCIALPMLFANNIVFAATTYEVHNVPDMTLHVRISTTQTTGIQINPPTRNGVTVTYPTTTGGVLELTQGTRVEHIYYSSATVDATTKIITLGGTILRNLSWNNCSAYVSNGNGEIFTPGAAVREVNDCRLYNFKLNKDRVNTLIGSGSLESAQTSQPFLFPNRVTTTQRDAFTYGTSATKNPLIFNTTTSVMQYWNGSAWINFGSGSTVNATEAIRGSVQLGTVKDQTGATVLGSTGAPTVVQTRYLTASGGLSMRGRVPLLGTNGFLSGALLGSGAPSSSTVLYGNNTWNVITNNMFGSGTGGTITWSSNTSLNPANQFNYTTSTLNAGVTLNVSTANTVLRLRSNNNVTINGTLNLTGSGAAGGGGGAVNTIGTVGTAGNSVITGYTVSTGAGGAVGTPGGGGGGGGSHTVTGTTGSANGGGAGGAGGAKIDANFSAVLANIFTSVSCGAGGAGGGGASTGAGNGAGGAGGQGGGCMTWFIGGDLTLGASSVINVSGKAGVASAVATNYCGGGGGGGGGGYAIIIVSGKINNAGVTLTSAGGTGGGGGSGGCTLGGAGGAGAAGKILIYSLSTGQLIVG